MSEYDRVGWHVVVGFGAAGERHVKLLHESGIANVAVVRTALGPTARATPPNLRECSSVEEALALQPVAAVIATPSSLHAEQAIELLEHQVPVLVEKPLATTLADASRVIETARAQSVNLSVGYHLRFHPAMRWLTSLVADGLHGLPRLLRASWGEYLPDWHPGEDFRTGYAARPDQGGGPILTLSHVLDYAVGLLGPTTGAWAMNSTVSDLGLGVPDTSIVALRHPSAVSDIELDFASRPPTHTVELRFDSARAFWDVNRNRLDLMTASGVAPTVDLALASRDQCFRDQMSHFLTQVEGGTQSDLEHELAVAATIQTAIDAADAATARQ